MAWGIATYFVVPVLVMEGAGPFAAMGRSRAVLRKTWGEALIGNVSIGLAFAVFTIPLALLAVVVVVPAVYASGAAGLLLLVPFVLVFVVLATIQSVLGSVFRAALYRYATTGQAGDAFGQTQLRAAFRTR